MYKTGIYWFTNDLRLSDNASLAYAASQCQKLICVFALDPRFRDPSIPQSTVVPSIIGNKRYEFLYASILDLKSSLESLEQRLLAIYAPPVQAISKLCEQFSVNAIFASQNAGFYEKRDWRLLKQQCPDIAFYQTPTHTIFYEQNLPFQLQELPPSFSKFRRLIEPLGQIKITPTVKSLPDPPLMDISFLEQLEAFPEPKRAVSIAESEFKGGETAAQQQLNKYLQQGHPSHYKKVRNHLDGWDNSTKFSPWLANGCLSARQVIKSIEQYEQNIEANESTYWIIFELIWREYFQWYAHRHKSRLFAYRGIQEKSLLTSFYANRFHAWCQGNTPFPIVNACMKQLNQTGYMSNRGRQIVASCFVNELELDWRYGAAYFEQQLIDYDVAINWGNWQYLAGVGADPRGKRHFDLQKQTQTYDPNLEFCKKWNGMNNTHIFKTISSLDAVDAADWPVG